MPRMCRTADYGELIKNVSRNTSIEYFIETTTLLINYMNEILPSADQEERASPSETLASSVYDRLRGDILSGRLEPGSKLRLQSLKETYQVGNSPIREALNRLSVSGMVVREENRGFRVAAAGIEELLELIKTRCWLEEIALRESIKNGDVKWEERIVLAFHWLSKVARTDAERSPEWEEHHHEFHLALLSACNSDILVGFCAQLEEQTLRYRNLAAVVEYRERHELEEHRAIQDAVLARDADKAVESLIAHYQITADIVIASGSLK